MKGRANLIMALLTFVVVTAAPLIQFQSDGDAETLPEVTITDRGGGLYTVDNPYLEGYFGIDPSPSSLNDPLSKGISEIVPKEIIIGGKYVDESRSWDPADGSIFGTEYADWGMDDQSITFPVRLSRAYDGEDVFRTPTDWAADIYIDSNGMHIGARCQTSPIGIGFTLESEYGIDELYDISMLQVVNLYGYTVGDFDGDGNEEIAIRNFQDVVVLGIGLNSSGNTRLLEEARIHFDIIPGKDSHYSPTSMSAADVDGDGKDEILMARGYYEGAPGKGEQTMLYLIDVQDKTVSSSVLGFTEVDGSPLDAVMVSVVGADVDGDGVTEIVIGGYLWNNSETGADYNKNWSKHGGELFLAYTEADKMAAGHPEFRMTVLGDDDGTAGNRFAGADHFKVKDHNEYDTSIYLTDDDDNHLGLCRSINWCNWTVPLGNVRMTSFDTNGYTEQLYFNTWFYQWDGQKFSVFLKTGAFKSTSDNNNVACNFLGSGMIWSDSPDDYDGSESFMLSYGCDMESHYRDGYTEWSFVIYDLGEQYATEAFGADLIDKGSVYQNWNHPCYCNRMYLANTDNDAYYALLEAQLYTYTDPTVVAFISAIPYDNDLAEMVVGGPDGIGSTEFERYTGTGTGTESTTTWTAGPSGSLEFWRMELEAETGITTGDSYSHTQTIEFSTAYESAEDTVAMYVIPMDIYVYRVFQSDGEGGVKESIQTIVRYHEAIDLTMEYEGYIEFMDGYNKVMKAYSEDFVEIPVIGYPDHVQGDISSFDEDPLDPLASVTVTYFGTGSHASVSKCVDLSSEDEHSTISGGSVSIGVHVTSLFRKIGIGGDVEMECEGADVTSTTNGMAFTSTLSNGMETIYLGDDNVVRQYRMEGRFWAEVRSLEASDGTGAQYVYVGYTVTDFESAPALGTLVPDIYVPDGSDEDDPYNPTPDAVYMLVTTPDVSKRPDVAPETYVLQMLWQGSWYDVNSMVLGIEAYMEDGDGWIRADSFVTDGGSPESVWFKITGLEGFSYYSYDFRLASLTSDGYNYTLPVTAYKDARIFADNILMSKVVSIEDGFAVIDNLGTVPKGLTAVFVDVGSSEIGPLALAQMSDDGTFKVLSDRLVNHDGYLLCIIGDEGSEDDKTMIPIIVIAVFVILAAAGAVMPKE